MKVRNKSGTLIQRRYPRKYARYPREKIQVPSTPTKHKHEAPSSKNIFFSALLCNGEMSLGVELYTGCSWCPHVSSQIRHFMYKPLQTEWESFFFPSRRPRPSPFWRGILQVPSYALPLCVSLRSMHASRYVRHASVVMHVGIADPRWQGKRSRHSWRVRNFSIFLHIWQEAQVAMASCWNKDRKNRWPELFLLRLT